MVPLPSRVGACIDSIPWRPPPRHPGYEPREPRPANTVEAGFEPLAEEIQEADGARPRAAPSSFAPGTACSPTSVSAGRTGREPAAGAPRARRSASRRPRGSPRWSSTGSPTATCSITTSRSPPSGPSSPPKDKGRITVRELLSHRAGLYDVQSVALVTSTTSSTTSGWRDGSLPPCHRARQGVPPTTRSPSAGSRRAWPARSPARACGTSCGPSSPSHSAPVGLEIGLLEPAYITGRDGRALPPDLHRARCRGDTAARLASHHQSGLPRPARARLRTDLPGLRPR